MSEPPSDDSHPLQSGLSRLTGHACVLIFLSLTLVVLWQVISRYALSEPSSASEELARILLMWLGLLGACYAHLGNQHISIELLPKLASGPRKLISVLACQIFSVVLLVGGGKLCLATFQLEQMTPTLGLPQGVVYSVLPLAGLLLSVANYFHLRKLS